MILHTVNTSPFAHSALDSCLTYLRNGDALLLLEDGVYAALADVDAGLERAGTVYALDADVKARGLASRLADGVEIVDYEGFVDLCTQFEKVKNWS